MKPRSRALFGKKKTRKVLESPLPSASCSAGTWICSDSCPSATSKMRTKRLADCISLSVCGNVTVRTQYAVALTAVVCASVPAVSAQIASSVVSVPLELGVGVGSGVPVAVNESEGVPGAVAVSASVKVPDAVPLDVLPTVAVAAGVAEVVGVRLPDVVCVGRAVGSFVPVGEGVRDGVGLLVPVGLEVTLGVIVGVNVRSATNAECPAPRATARTGRPLGDGRACGVAKACRASPSPSSPRPLYPHTYITPPATNAVCAAPRATAVTAAPLGGRRRRGAGTDCAPVPSPSCPQLLRPQTYSAPPAMNAVCARPRATAVTARPFGAGRCQGSATYASARADPPRPSWPCRSCPKT